MAAAVVAGIDETPRFYDFRLIVVMLLLTWGEVLGFYDSWSFYDKVVQFSVPLLLTRLIYLLLVRLGVLPELRDPQAGAPPGHGPPDKHLGTFFTVRAH